MDRGIGWISESARRPLLVLLEILILLSGVVARYVFNAPLTWSDELASILFLWLAMLGAVIALRRGEHMRLTTLVKLLPRPGENTLELGAQLLVAAFVLEILLPAYEYVGDAGRYHDAGAGNPRWLARRGDCRSARADAGDRR